MRMIPVISQDHGFIEVHDFDATLEGRLYVDAEVIVTTSPDVVENIPPAHLIHSMFPLQVHHQIYPLSVIICHLLHVMIC